MLNKINKRRLMIRIILIVGIIGVGTMVWFATGILFILLFGYGMGLLLAILEGDYSNVKKDNSIN